MNPRGIEPRACAVEKEWGYQRFFSSSIEIVVVAVCWWGRRGRRRYMNPRGIEPRAYAVEKERGYQRFFSVGLKLRLLLCAGGGKAGLSGTYTHLRTMKESSGNLGGLRRIKIHNCLFGELEIFELDTM